MYGMDADRLTDVRLVAQELAVNTLTHSPNGRGVLEVWTADDHLVLQVEDGGRITDPLVGRRPPEPPHVGHGLFVVHQLADLVRIHRDTSGAPLRCRRRRYNPGIGGSSALRCIHLDPGISSSARHRPSGSPPPARTGPSR